MTREQEIAYLRKRIETLERTLEQGEADTINNVATARALSELYGMLHRLEMATLKSGGSK